MSQRHPSHDARYDPRERSRSPSRFIDRRQSAAYPPNFPPPGQRIPPHGPRGRGAPFNDGPDARGPPPFGAGRDRPFNDFNDRRTRPPSPPRNFRDAPSPRDLDPSRARRNSRDGPYSGESAPSDSPFASRPFPHGGFSARGRGRGRGDFDRGDRSRRPQFDDRPAFRQRSPPRWNRDASRESREEWRSERPEEDRWSNRDTRDREGPWNRMSMNQQRFDARSTAESSSRPPTPSQNTPQQPSTPSERPQPDTRTPLDRRASTSFLARPEGGAPADQTARAEAFAARPRASSPPQAPSVPAFGAMTFGKPPPTGQNAPPNVWRAPAESRPPPSPVVPAVAPPPQSPVSKPIPTAPKALAMSPVTTPKAPTVPTSPVAQRLPVEAPRGPRGFDAAQPPVSQPTKQSSQPPTGPAALRGDDRPAPPSFPPTTARDRPSVSAISTAVAPPKFSVPTWSQPPPPPPTPKMAQSEVSIAQQSPSVPRHTPTGPLSQETRSRPEHNPSIPTGPRQQQSPSLTSPRMPPTAPKADRAPPTGPRAANERGMAALTRAPERPPIAVQRSNLPFGPRNAAQGWNAWQQQQRPFREGVVPAKRDANGDEVARGPHTSPNQARADPAVVKTEESKVQDDGTQTAEAKREQNQDRKDTGEIDDIGDPVEPVLDSSSDDDDGMDLDEEDFEMPTRKFEMRKAQLESQMVDLSAREYRVTTPFEQIARIIKITAEDLPAESDDMPEGEAPDLEEEPEEEAGLLSGSADDVDQDLLTPKEEEEAKDVVMADSDVLDTVLPPPRRREPSPEIINLPYLMKEPFSPGEGLQNSLLAQERTKAALIEYYHSVKESAEMAEMDAADKYADSYRELKEATRLVEEERAERERIERQKSAELAGEAEAATVPLETPTSEGSRRLHKFSSEYDIQKVLKESEEMARKEQEKNDINAQRTRLLLEREAVLPVLYDDELLKRAVFKNTNNLRHPEQMITVVGYQPPPDNFTPEEHQTFIDAFKEGPKKWGNIADLLPGRTYQHCIHHYYTHKWDGRFRETKGKRKGRGPGRGRGGKVGPRNRGAALMADLTRADEDVPAPSTENGTNANGRPKRAAAVRGAAQESQPESRATSATPARRPGNKNEGEEKPAKKRRGAAGEKVAKKSKAQPPVIAAEPEVKAQPAGSPIKADRELQFRANELTSEEKARMDEANLLAGFQAGSTQPRAGSIPVYHTTNFFDSSVPAPEPAERSRIPVVSASQRQAASSYWSVPEQNDFVKFLGYYGTDFAAIAAQMGTKTQTMVKNHYQRRIEGDNKDEFLRTAEAANVRRQRGEDMGPPPTPTPIVKRRYDNPPTGGRPGAGQIEPVEDEAGRFGSAVPAAPARTAPTPLQAALATATAKAVAQNAGRPPQAPGPRMGFFSETGGQRAPQQPPLARTSSEPSQGRPTSQTSQPPREQISAAWYQNLLQEQERALKLQSEIARPGDRMPQLPHQNVYPALAPQPSPDDKSASQRPGSGRSRNSNGSPVPSITAPPLLPHSQAPPGSIPSPPKLTGFRPSSVPATSPVIPPALSAKPTEPRKTSNLASLLNSEPEEPRPVAKRMSDHSVPGVNRPQSPASIQRNPTPTSSVQGQRRDTFGSGAPPRNYYERPRQTTPGLTPAQPKYESVWSNVSTGRREEWAPRQAPPPPPSASPGPNALERQERFYPHRSSLGQLSDPARANPSPPPHHPHSRDGPFAVPSGQPQQPPPSHPMSSHQMGSNPYGQQPPSHRSQHNSPVGQTQASQPIHARRPSREEEFRAQAAAEKWGYRQPERREYERPPLATPSLDREREREREAQAQAQARVHAQSQYVRDRDAALRDRDARDRDAHYAAAAEARFRSNTGPPLPGAGIGAPPMSHAHGHGNAPPPPMTQAPPGYSPALAAGPSFRPDQRYDPQYGKLRERESIIQAEREKYEREVQVQRDRELRDREMAYARDREMQRERDMQLEHERQQQQQQAQQQQQQQQQRGFDRGFERDRELQRQRDFERERDIQREREKSLRDRERERDARQRESGGPRTEYLQQQQQPPQPPQSYPPASERREFPAAPPPQGAGRERHEFAPGPPPRDPFARSDEAWRGGSGGGGRAPFDARPPPTQQGPPPPSTSSSSSYADRQAMEDESRRRRDDELRMMQREPYLPRSGSGGSIGGPSQQQQQQQQQGYQTPAPPQQQQGYAAQQGLPLGGFRHHPPPGPGMGAPPGAPTGPRR